MKKACVDYRLNTLFCLTLLSLLILFSCKKEHSSGLVSNGDPKTGNNDSNCVTNRADAEKITIFPTNNPWNTDISGMPINPNSSLIIAGFASAGLKADFGSGLWDGAPIGIPFVVICGSQPKVDIVFRANSYDGNYGDESDPGPYPIPLNAPVEGDGSGDSHVIAVDKDHDYLYELYNASVNGDHWEASSGAVFNLSSNELRPDGWTSADAAGLPIFPGLVRYDELASGTIDHAIRFTLSRSNIEASYIYPARHKVNGTAGQYGLPMGARLRLKNSVDISQYSPRLQIILTALKKYGLILADIGSDMYISGAPDDRWNNDELHQLGGIIASDFEVVITN